MEKLLKEESHTVNKIKKKIENLNFCKILVKSYLLKIMFIIQI